MINAKIYFELIDNEINSIVQIPEDLTSEEQMIFADRFSNLIGMIQSGSLFPSIFQSVVEAGMLTEQKALELAIKTWGDIKPVVHYSESRRDEKKDDTIRVQAHSDYVYEKIETYGHDIDIMVEAKAKELAVQKYLELHNGLS